MLKKLKLGIIGLGYVGLPLAIEFGRKRSVVAFDINKNRIEDLKKGYDFTFEVDSEDLNGSIDLLYTSDANDLLDCNFFIVTVPTPINNKKEPDLYPLLSASETIGNVISKGDIVVFESTVYPGATEEECIPIIEKHSKLKFNRDFFAGYSPERINPGDKKHKVTNIVKITSGSTPEIAEIIDGLYNEIILAGTHKASSIRVAEAAKVIENTQRDLNIALVNELALIFNKMNIDTAEVLEAARTKWNFLDFRPGLVGGHCIGVDPYYLTYKAQSEGYPPEIILAGRKLNDSMSSYVVSRLIEQMAILNINVKYSKVLILGATFKENCPDLRNSKVLDIIVELLDYKISVDVFDPWIKKSDLKSNPVINLVNNLKKNEYDAVILAVAHKEIISIKPSDYKIICKKNSVVYDLKSILPKEFSDLRL